MKELIGWVVSVEWRDEASYHLDSHPVCEDVNMPMIKIDGTWYHVDDFQSIEAFFIPFEETVEGLIYDGPSTVNFENAPHSATDLLYKLSP